MNEMIKKPTAVELDDFTGYTGEIEGQDDARASGRVIQGSKIKFIDPRWLDPDEEDITGKVLTVIGLLRVVNKWDLNTNVPLVTQILAPGQKFPNFDKLNAECPQSEWGEKFGKMVGPWAGQQCLYFVDENLNRYTWPSPITTIGSAICIRELVDQVNLVRKFRGPNVYAMTERGHTDFPNSYKPRRRPHLLNVKDWIKLGPDQTGGPLPAPDKDPEIAPPTASSGSASPASSASSGGAPAGAQSVTPPTAKEITEDEILF